MQCPQIVCRNARLDLAAYWKAKGLEKGLEMEKEQSTMFRFRWICPEFSELKPNLDGGFVGENTGCGFLALHASGSVSLDNNVFLAELQGI